MSKSITRNRADSIVIILLRLFWEELDSYKMSSKFYNKIEEIVHLQKPDKAEGFPT